jgi:hypothetical protein
VGQRSKREGKKKVRGRRNGKSWRGEKKKLREKRAIQRQAIGRVTQGAGVLRTHSRAYHCPLTMP